MPFIEELSDLELEAISGGGGSLIDADVVVKNNEIVKDVNVAVNALGKSVLQQR